MGLDSDQIHYLKTVLGVSDVLLPHAVEPEAASPDQIPTEIRGAVGNAKMVLLLPLNAKEFPLHGPLEELVDRMMKAMKLEPSQILRLSWVAGAGELPGELPEAIENLVDQASHKPILIFGHEEAKAFIAADIPLGEWHDFRAGRSIATYAPRDLLTSNENKRVAWVHLQTVMKELR